MAPTRFFNNIDGNVHELLERGPYRYERELQEFFERHLHTLTGVEFLASEYSTGRHGRRIDTLGIDGAGRPVVVEYKRRQAPPGIKLTLRSFGKDRRYPITNRYRGAS